MHATYFSFSLRFSGLSDREHKMIARTAGTNPIPTAEDLYMDQVRWTPNVRRLTGLAPREYYEGMINYCTVTGEAYPHHLSDAILSPDNPGCHPVEFHRRIAFSLISGRQPNYMSTFSCLDTYNHAGLGRNELEKLERFRPNAGNNGSIFAWKSRAELKTKAMDTVNYQLRNRVVPRNVLPNAESGLYRVKAFRPSVDAVKKLAPPLVAALNAVMDEDPEKGKPLRELDPFACTNLYLEGLVYFEVDLPPDLRLKSAALPESMASVVQRSGLGKVERLAVDARTLCVRNGATAEDISSALGGTPRDALNAFRLMFRLGLVVVDSAETSDRKTETSRSTPVMVIQDYLAAILLSWPRGKELGARALELRETGITRNSELVDAIESACYDIRTEEAVALAAVSREEIDDPLFYWKQVISSLGTLASWLRTYEVRGDSPIVALQEPASERDSDRRFEVLQKLLMNCGPCIFVEPAEPIPGPLEVLASACLPTSRACMEGWCTLFLCRMVGSSAPTALLPNTRHFHSWIGGFPGRLRSHLRVLFSSWSTGEHYVGTLENVMCETEDFFRGPVVARILPPGNVPSQTSLSFLNVCVQPVLVEDCECMYVVFPTEKFSGPEGSRFYSKGIPGEIDHSKPVPLAQAANAGLIAPEDVEILDDMLTRLLSNCGCFGFFYATLRIVRFSSPASQGETPTEEEEEDRKQIEPRSGGWGVWDVRWGASLNPVLASSMMECEVGLKPSYRNMFSQNNKLWCKRLQEFVLQMRKDEASLRARCGLGTGSGVREPVLRTQWAEVHLGEDGGSEPGTVRTEEEDGNTGPMPHGPPVCIHAFP